MVIFIEGGFKLVLMIFIINVNYFFVLLLIKLLRMLLKVFNSFNSWLCKFFCDFSVFDFEILFVRN